MTESLAVELNRDRLHGVEAPPSFATTESFAIELENLGEAVHVHLHLDDALSRVARIDSGNHFVEGGKTRRVAIDVGRVREQVSGKLKVVTGYGAETAYVDVTVEPPEEGRESVEVDERLSRPPDREVEPSQLERAVERVLENGTLPVVAFAVFALVVAVLTAVFVNSTAVMLGVGIVIGGVAVALWTALQ